MKSKYSLQLKRPFGKTLALSMLLLILMTALFEMAARTHFIQSLLPVPVIASGHRRLDLKLAFLEKLAKEDGPVDCIFVGSSMTHRAIDPEVFGRAYKQKSGKNIICFNFGVSGFIPPAAALVAPVLNEMYHPKLLIWGLSPITFSSKLKTKMRNFLTSNPWLQYRLGKFNPEGWITDHFYSYRYFLRFRIWLERPEYSEVLTEREASLSRFGFPYSTKIGLFKPDPARISGIRKRVRGFKKTKAAAAALEQIMRLHPRIQVVIVEIPVHPVALSQYGKGSEVHRQTTSYIRRRAKHHGILFLPTINLNLIPAEGWKDINHLNPLGARIFSHWLGEQINKAIEKGLLKKL